MSIFVKMILQAIKKTEHNTINRFLHNAEETAPKVIHDILYRELKERLERGDFG